MLKDFLKEFKDFAEKGSAVDMAVGVIVGATMNGVVNSLVKDIIMPPVGLLLGGVDFSEIFLVLKDPKVGMLENLVHEGGRHYATLSAAQSAGATTLNIGLFANAIISFIITMFAVFMFVKIMNKIRDKKVTTRTCPYCKMATVNVAATICPYCCSRIKPVPVPDSKSHAGSLIPVKNIGEKLGKQLKKITK
ncbi:MAG: large conductance mechanosensitive channel protein MscL [Rickettsiales bacterium]|jgi:large conductance mechanosensitive channel|nr:large conductance mechanosensitive channel protein MscL [Rickettsiales bacterium]